MAGTLRWTPEKLAEHQKRIPPSFAPPSFRPDPVSGGAFWPVIPRAAPRQVRSDKWKPRPGVVRYRQFRDDVARAKVWAPTPGDWVVFLLPIPKSWSKTRRLEADGQMHEQKPDFDNLVKSLCDACYADDAHIWTLVPGKVWSSTPGIYIERREPLIPIPFKLPAELLP